MKLTRLVEQLSACNPSEQLDEAVHELSECISKDPTLIGCVISQYPYNKAGWEGKARVIANQSDLVLERYAAGILDWLQDLSWPGSLTLFDRLASVRPGRIDCAIRESIEFAQSLGDEEWICFLRRLQRERAKNFDTSPCN